MNIVCVYLMNVGYDIWMMNFLLCGLLCIICNSIQEYCVVYWDQLYFRLEWGCSVVVVSLYMFILGVYVYRFFCDVLYRYVCLKCLKNRND